MNIDPRTLPPLDINQRYTIEEAAAYLRICRAQVYSHINDGTLNSVKDGRRTFIPGKSIAALSSGETGDKDG